MKLGDKMITKYDIQHNVLEMIIEWPWHDNDLYNDDHQWCSVLWILELYFQFSSGVQGNSRPMHNHLFQVQIMHDDGSIW